MAIKRVCYWNPGGEVRDAAKLPNKGDLTQMPQYPG